MYTTAQKENQTASEMAPAPGVRLQAKLSIGAVNDPLEHEADAMADKVMQMQEITSATGTATGSIQRKCAHCEEEEKLQRKPLASFIQRKESSAGTVASDSASNQINASKGSGNKMDSSTQSFMQSRFGTDFNDVKIHTGVEAIQMNRELSAKAFTVGNDIYFNEGQYNPNSNDGKHLLAHELTHTVQQGAGVSRKIQRLVRTSLVTCPVGQNPFSADRRASALLTNALTVIDAALAARALNPADPNFVLVGSSMHTAFRLNAANNPNWIDPAPHFGIPLIRRRIEAVKNYIDGVVFTINCHAAGDAFTIAGCTPSTCHGQNATSCSANPTELILCPPFWALSSNERAKTILHEIFHVTFAQIDDWTAPDSLNAHCYSQFVALLNGFNPISRCH